MALVRFLRGVDSAYSYNLTPRSTAHENAIYFAQDTGLLYVNGVKYGGDNALKVQDVTVNGSVLTVTYTDNTTNKINVLDLIPEATVSTKGLMSASDKSLVAELASERNAGMSFISPAQASIIANVGANITNLQSAIDGLGKDIDSVEAKINAIDLTQYAKSSDVNSALTAKVGVSEYNIFKNTVDAKLAEVEGAQANVLEGIIYNGTRLDVDPISKTVEIVTPESKINVASGEKVLTFNSESGELGTTLSMEYFRDSEDNNTPKLRLKGVNGEQVGEAIDVSDFVKDGMLTDVELVENPDDKIGTYFRFTWNTDSGIEPVVTDLDVTGLIDVYESGNGISVTGKTISAKVKDGDQFIEVTTEGIASKGITAAITAAKNEVLGSNENTSANITVYGVKKYVEELTSALNTSVSAIKVTDVDSTPNSGISIVKSTSGVISTAVNIADLGTALVENNAISGTSIKIGYSVTRDGEEIISSSDSIHDAIQSLSDQIKTVSSGGITDIKGDEYISVTGVSARTITLNIAEIGNYMVDNTSALKTDEDGKMSIKWEVLY